MPSQVLLESYEAMRAPTKCPYCGGDCIVAELTEVKGMEKKVCGKCVSKIERSAAMAYETGQVAPPKQKYAKPRSERRG